MTYFIISHSDSCNKYYILQNGWTALQLLACNGNTEITESLLAKGANPCLHDMVRKQHTNE